MPQVRGVEIYLGLIDCSDCSINEFKFKSSIAIEVGTNTFDLEKDLSKLSKINLNNNLLKLPLAISGVLNRNEKRYMNDNIDWMDAYWRKSDQFNVLRLILMDLFEFGLSSMVMANIMTFASKLVDPSINLRAVELKTDDNNSNNNNNNNNSSNNDNIENNNNFKNIGVLTPLCDLYKVERINLGSGFNVESLDSRILRGEKLEFSINGSCLWYNLGTPESKHLSCCGYDRNNNKINNNNNNNNVSDVNSSTLGGGHLSTHVCIICGGAHPMWKCRILRASFTRAPFDTQWRTRGYENDNMNERRYRGRFDNMNFYYRGNYRGRGGYRGNFRGNFRGRGGHRGNFCGNNVKNERR